MKAIQGAAVELVRRAILTMAATPDPECRFLAGPRCGLPDPIHDPMDAYGYESPRSIRFRPTPRDASLCLEVLGWVSGLRNVDPETGRDRGDGRRDVALLIAWAHGASDRALAERFGRTDRTIRNWRSGALTVIAFRNWQAIDRIMQEDSRWT